LVAGGSPMASAISRCHGVAGQRVHDQQHVLALVAEVLGQAVA
jgi:hypothetical protein